MEDIIFIFSKRRNAKKDAGQLILSFIHAGGHRASSCAEESFQLRQGFPAHKLRTLYTFLGFASLPLHAKCKNCCRAFEPSNTYCKVIEFVNGHLSVRNDVLAPGAARKSNFQYSQSTTENKRIEILLMYGSQRQR